jgi:hypothetical protein
MLIYFAQIFLWKNLTSFFAAICVFGTFRFNLKAFSVGLET